MSEYDDFLDRELSDVVADEQGQPREAAMQADQWLRERQKPDAAGLPFRGFGPEGMCSPRIRPLGVSTAIRFRDGVPTEVDVPGIDTDPELEALRLRIKDGCRRVDTLVISVPWLVMVYTARLLRMNYNLTDADLDLLLGGQKLWAEGVIRYISGGNERVGEIVRAQPGTVDEAFLTLAIARQEAAAPPAVPQGPAATPSASKLRRAIDFITFWN